MSLWRMGVQLFWVIVILKFCLQFTDIWGFRCWLPGLTLLVICVVYDYRQWNAWAQRLAAQQQKQQRPRSRQGAQQNTQAYRQAQQRGQQYTQAWQQQKQKGQPQVYPVNMDELDRLMAYDYIDSLC